MSGEAMVWVWTHAPVSGARLLALLALADNADDEGMVAVETALATLPDKTRMSLPDVRRILQDLEDIGVIRWDDRHPTQPHMECYRLIMMGGRP